METPRCSKCNSEITSTVRTYSYHYILECVECGNWTFERLTECCRNPRLIVAQDHKFQDRTRLYKQCLNCGGCVNRTKPLSFKSAGEKCEAEFDNFRFEDWKIEVRKESAELWEAKKNHTYFNSSYHKYQQYLTSDIWREKRSLVFTRDNNICTICNTSKAEEVHHLTYDNLYNEPLNDLTSVCQKCHKGIHAKV